MRALQSRRNDRIHRLASVVSAQGRTGQKRAQAELCWSETSRSHPNLCNYCTFQERGTWDSLARAIVVT